MVTCPVILQVWMEYAWKWLSESHLLEAVSCV